jgi:hypothetical protein
VSTAIVTANHTASGITRRLVVKGFVFSLDGLRTIMVDVEITDPLTIAEVERSPIKNFSIKE